MAKRWTAKSPMSGYLVAIAATLTVLLLRLLLTPLVGDSAYFFPFVIAVTLSAWYGGLNPGLLSTVLGSALAVFFFVPPHYGFRIDDPRIAIGLIFFFIASVIISLVCDALHKALRRVGYVPQRESVDWDFPVNVMDVVLMGRYGRVGMVKRPSKEDREIARADMRKQHPFGVRYLHPESPGEVLKAFARAAHDTEELGGYFSGFDPETFGRLDGDGDGNTLNDIVIAAGSRSRRCCTRSSTASPSCRPRPRSAPTHRGCGGSSGTRTSICTPSRPVSVIVERMYWKPLQ